MIEAARLQPQAAVVWRSQDACSPYGQIRADPAAAGPKALGCDLLDLGIHRQDHAATLEFTRRLVGHRFRKPAKDARSRLDHCHAQIEPLVCAQAGREGAVALDQFSRELDPGRPCTDNGDIEPLAGCVG
ncbi:hypothetical protein D3C80_1383050 [compost metagenome]